MKILLQLGTYYQYYAQCQTFYFDLSLQVQSDVQYRYLYEAVAAYAKQVQDDTRNLPLFPDSKPLREMPREYDNPNNLIRKKISKQIKLQ